MSWGAKLKELAVAGLREYQRYTADCDATECTCGHVRSKHCGCGEHCLGLDDMRPDARFVAQACPCKGFVTKPEPTS